MRYGFVCAWVRRWIKATLENHKCAPTERATERPGAASERKSKGEEEGALCPTDRMASTTPKCTSARPVVVVVVVFFILLSRVLLLDTIFDLWVSFLVFPKIGRQHCGMFIFFVF